MSSTDDTVCAPYSSTRLEMKSSSSFFESVRLRKSWYVVNSPSSSPTASRSARSTSALKMTRPAVVSTSSPSQRYSIGSCRPVCFASSANSTSSSERNRFGRGSIVSTDSSSKFLSEYVR